jgi:hypothetical protein
MSFVFPALLGGLILTGVPLLLHLIMRRKPKRQPFPAFRYLVKRHRTNQRRLRLRHLLLLALRIGLIGAICLALARPRALNERLLLSSDRAVAAVFLFDTSYSMEYAVGNRSRLDEAKRRALEWLDELPEGSRVAVLDSAEGVKSGRGEWLASLVQARERIGRLQLKPANQPVTTRLQSAYLLFSELAQSKSTESNLPRLLCVFSDRTLASWDAGKLPELYEVRDAVPPPLELMQRFRDEIPALLDLLSRWPPNLPSPPNTAGDAKSLGELLQKLRDLVGSLRVEEYPDRPTLELLARVSAATRGVLVQVRPDDKAEPAVREYREKATKALQEAQTSLRGVHEVFVDVGAERPDDLAILGLELPRLAARNQAKQVFNADERIRLQAVVQATGRDFNQMLTAFLDQRKLPIQPAVELKAREKRSVLVEIDTKELKPGPHQVEVRLAAPDAMPFNNSRQVTFLLRKPRNVLIITDEPDNAAPWKLALDLRGTGPYRCEVVKPDSDKLRPDFLAPFVAVYLMSVKEPKKELWDALENYVQRGGGLGLIPGDQDQLNKESYQGPAAKRLLPGIFESIAGSENAEGDIWDFGKDAIFQHPLLGQFRIWRNDKTIDFISSPRRAKFYWVVAPSKETNVLVRYAGKKERPALLESRPGAAAAQGGKVLQFTTPLDLREKPWNDYFENLNSFYLVLATLATNYLAGDVESIPLNFVSGQAPPSLPRSFTGRLSSYQIRGPSLTESVSVADDQADIQFPQAAAPGNYAVEDMDGQPVARFSVNMPPEESSLDQVPAEQIEALFGPRSVVPINYRSNLNEELSGHWRQPVELFPALLAALLLLLAFENLLANKFYKRDPEAEKEAA